ncbi:MAG TPA: FAD-binding oxidoreductase [Streptosporangiales bacterium]
MRNAQTLEKTDPGYDDARAGFQLAVDREPDEIVVAGTADDVRAAVKSAADRELPVGVEATGHGRSVATDRGVQVATRELTGVSVDAASRTARVLAGTRWRDVIDASHRHGLAPLSGTSPDVGAVGYTLGGGLPLVGRRYGYAADHVLGIDVVTADGEPRHASADSEPELFWALRGGRGNFGAVTAMEIALFPLPRLYGGMLAFTGEHVHTAVHAYLEWTRDLPEEMSSSLGLIVLPDMQGVPEPLRGRFTAQVRIAYAGAADAGERLVAPLRAAAPRALDTLTEIPYTESGSIHSEPPWPHGYCGTGVALTGLDAGRADAVVRLAGPASPVPCIVQVRHLGGALARPPAVANCVGNRGAAYMLSVLSPLFDVTADAARTRHEQVVTELSSSVTGRFVNYLYGDTATPEQIRAGYEPDDYRLLTELKFRYDPQNIFRLDHPIPPAK